MAVGERPVFALKQAAIVIAQPPDPGGALGSADITNAIGCPGRDPLRCTRATVSGMDVVFGDPVLAPPLVRVNNQLAQTP
jgi:hypothetical protein